MLDRRTFAKGAAVLGAVGAVAGSVTMASQLGGCSAAPSSVGEPTVVEDGSQVSIVDDYEYVEDPPGLTASGEWSLPLGTVLHPSEGNWIAATAPGASNADPVRACAFSLANAELRDVVTAPFSASRGRVVSDARASDSVYAWSECDPVTGAWTLFGAAFRDGALQGSPMTLWEADGEWDDPRFACSGDAVVWLVMPTADGSHSTEESSCYIWHVGQKSATLALTSPGRFATEPAISEGTVTLAPRVRPDEGVYYGIVAYDLADDLATTIDSLVLPVSVRPMSAVRMGDKFVFQIEADYASGGLLGKMGTYIGSGDGEPFLAISREPSVAAAGRGPFVLVKSRASYIDADTSKDTYGVVTALDRSLSYGEFPARVGTCERFVTFATVKDKESGYPQEVKVRAFDIAAA